MTSPNTEQATSQEVRVMPSNTSEAFLQALETAAAEVTQNWPMPGVYEPIFEGVPTLGV